MKKAFGGAVGLAMLLMPGHAQGQEALEATLAVDFGKPMAGVKSMSGLLHALNDTTPHDSLIRPLRPHGWRISGSNHHPRIKRLGVDHIEYVLSDGYGYKTKVNPGTGLPGPAWPYEDWPRWEAYVREKANGHKGKGFHFNVWNEPNIKSFFGGTMRQYCETYERAYRIFREVAGPEEMIGGPDLNRYLADSMRIFMDYALEKGLEVNFACWHYLYAPAHPLWKLQEEIAQFRRDYMDNPKYAPLKIRKIAISEISAWSVQYIPADILGHFHYLEKGGAAAAFKACWKEDWKRVELVLRGLDKLPFLAAGARIRVRAVRVPYSMLEPLEKPLPLPERILPRAGDSLRLDLGDLALHEVQALTLDNPDFTPASSAPPRAGEPSPMGAGRGASGTAPIFTSGADPTIRDAAGRYLGPGIPKEAQATGSR